MPVYEYLCEKCGHEFEREQRITEEPVKVCPACRAKKVRRLISRTAFVLKGSGWYSDLYASSKSAAKDGDGPKGDGGGGGGSDSQSAKPESGASAKTEPKSAAKGSKKGTKAHAA